MVRCIHCGRKVKKNPRIKGVQRYCGLKACQAARKNLWELERISTTPEYKDKRKASKSRWRKANGYFYQRRYRETHPDYARENGQKQLERNQKARDGSIGPMIVKTDALSSARLVNDGFYALVPYQSADIEKIVKTDTLIVQLKGVQAVTASVAINSS